MGEVPHMLSPVLGDNRLKLPESEFMVTISSEILDSPILILDSPKECRVFLGRESAHIVAPRDAK